MISFLSAAIAIALFVGGNLWFFFRFFDKPRSTIIEEDHEHVPGDFT